MLKTLSNKSQEKLMDINEETKGLAILKDESQNWIRFSEHALKSWDPNKVFIFSLVLEVVYFM